MKTRNNIYPLLENSPFYAILHYRESPVKYQFSSQLYLTKFLQRLEENRETIAQSLSKRFKVSVTLDLLADVFLYTKIEKRGFHITTPESEVIKCQDNLTLNGVQQIGQK